MNRLESIAIGMAGVATSIASGSIDPDQLSAIAQVVVQLIIGIATLWGLFRKKKAT